MSEPIDEVMKLVEYLKHYRFYHGSFRKRMDGKLRANFLAEGRTGYIYDEIPASAHHPGLILGHMDDYYFQPPEKMYELTISKALAEQLDPSKIVVDEQNYKDIYHPYVPALLTVKLTPVCVNCQLSLAKSLKVWQDSNEDEDYADSLECSCGWIGFSAKEVAEEIAKCNARGGE